MAAYRNRQNKNEDCESTPYEFKNRMEKSRYMYNDSNEPDDISLLQYTTLLILELRDAEYVCLWGEGTFYVITFCVRKSFGTQFEKY